MSCNIRTCPPPEISNQKDINKVPNEMIARMWTFLNFIYFLQAKNIFKS